MLSDIDLGSLYKLAQAYASSDASPHHITFTVEGLRNLIAAIEKEGAGLGAPADATSSLDYAQRVGHLGTPEEWKERCRLFRCRMSVQDCEDMAKLRTYVEEGLLRVVRAAAPGAATPAEQRDPWQDRETGGATHDVVEGEKDKIDAERYRWLRPRFRSHWATYRGDTVVASSPMVGIDIPDVFGKRGDPRPVIDIDAAIDAARQSLKGQGNG